MTENSEQQWNKLKASNTERAARLARQGISIDTAGIVEMTWIEHILQALVGDDGVMACRVDTQLRIAAIYDQAEAQLPRARLLAPNNGKGH
ncbi:MAG: hypothetical protein ACYCZM_11970 [Acidimicrobiales bacterium]